MMKITANLTASRSIDLTFRPVPAATLEEKQAILEQNHSQGELAREHARQWHADRGLEYK